MGGLRSALCEGREADAIDDEFDADRLKKSPAAGSSLAASKSATVSKQPKVAKAFVKFMALRSSAAFAGLANTEPPLN
jgi:hypothetical protein